MLLEGGVFRGLAPAVSLSAESGRNEKERPPNPKKQSPPKSKILMVVIRERECRVKNQLRKHEKEFYLLPNLTLHSQQGPDYNQT